MNLFLALVLSIVIVLGGTFLMLVFIQLAIVGLLTIMEIGYISYKGVLKTFFKKTVDK